MLERYGSDIRPLLTSRDRKTSSAEQNLDDEPSSESRESAGPDDRGDGFPRSPRHGSYCRRHAASRTVLVRPRLWQRHLLYADLHITTSQTHLIQTTATRTPASSGERTFSSRQRKNDPLAFGSLLRLSCPRAYGRWPARPVFSLIDGLQRGE